MVQENCGTVAWRTLSDEMRTKTTRGRGGGRRELGAGECSEGAKLGADSGIVATSSLRTAGDSGGSTSLIHHFCRLRRNCSDSSWMSEWPAKGLLAADPLFLLPHPASHLSLPLYSLRIPTELAAPPASRQPTPLPLPPHSHDATALAHLPRARQYSPSSVGLLLTFRARREEVRPLLCASVLALSLSLADAVRSCTAQRRATLGSFHPHSSHHY